MNNPNPKTSHNVLLFLRTYKKVYFILGFFLILRVALELGLAKILMDITDSAVKGKIDVVISLLKYGILLIICYSLLNYLFAFLGGNYTGQVKMDMRNSIFKHIFKGSVNVFKQKAPGDLVSRINNDINIMSESLINNTLMLVFTPLMAFASFIYMFHLYWKLAIFALLLGPITLILSFIFGKLINKYSESLYVQLSNLNNLLIDSFGGRKIIKLFALEKLFLEKNQSQTQKIYGIERKISNSNAIFQACVGIVANLSFILSIGFGTYLIVNGEITVGVLIAFITLLNHVVEPFMSIGGIIGEFAKSLSATDRIYELLSSPLNTKNKATKSIKEVHTEIKLENLTFSHDKEITLNGISVTIPINKNIAIVGPSGSGKSTLLNILLKSESANSGRISFDDNSLYDICDSDINNLFSIVNQEGYLFKSTIKENILYGNPNASMEEVIEAAKLAHAHEFICSLPKGYDTIYGENSTQLSGGQKQRIIIARAIIKNAPIFLFDEAMTALDSNTQSIVLNNLSNFLKNKTTIIVTHQLSNIQNVDLIIVMNEGKIAEQGNHETLLEKKGLYCELYLNQLLGKNTQNTA